MIYKFDMDEVLEAAIADDNSGFCLSCGNHQYNCEPDARDYLCEECGQRRVHGAAEVLLCF